MAYEDFTTYDETDEGDNVTVIASKVSWVSLTRGESSYVSKSKGSNHFSGDFTHQFVCNFSDRFSYALVGAWALANVQNDLKGIVDSSGDGLFFGQESSALVFKLYTVENGSLNGDISITFTASTDYYVTIVRDDDGGANSTGQITATIRTGSHVGSVFDILTVDCGVGEQNDFEYIYGLQGYDSGSGGAGSISGYTENLDLNEVSVSIIPLIMYNRRMNNG